MPTASNHNHEDSVLDLSDIITAEFNYIAQTAFQSNEDRARVSTFYLSSAASLIAAIATSQLLGDSSQPSSANQQAVAWAFAFLFGTLSFSGLLTILKLARLRLAWLKSARAMNHLKQFCVEANGAVAVEQLFLWNSDSLPKAASPTSLSSLLALQVVAMTGLMTGTCVYHIGIIRGEVWLYQAIVSGMLALMFLVAVYAVMVSERSVNNDDSHKAEEGQDEIHD